MALGYESYVTITKNAGMGGGSATLLCTSASAPYSAVRLESSSAYYGQYNDPGDTGVRAIGRPHAYGYPLYEGNLNVDMSGMALSDFIKPWITQGRENPYTVSVSPRYGGLQTFSSAYWRKISFSTSSGNQVVMGLQFASEAEDSYAAGGGYYNNQTGHGPVVPPVAFTDPPMPDMLNPQSVNNVNPIPFWNTQIKFDGSAISGLIDWHLDFNQDVNFFFTCENSSGMIAPSYVAVGLLNIVCGGNAVIIDSAAPEAATSIEVIMGQTYGEVNGNRFYMTYPEKNQRVDPIVGNAATPIHSFDYTLYGLKVS